MKIHKKKPVTMAAEPMLYHTSGLEWKKMDFKIVFEENDESIRAKQVSIYQTERST